MIQWIFPARCVVCNQIVVPKGAMIHINCAKKLEFVKEPICKKCGIPMDSLEQEYCIPCLSMDRGWDLGRSVFYYHGVAGIALRQVKKVGTKEFVHFFAVQMRETQKEYMKRIAPNCLVPIPLHPSKFRRRGFNQAELLARALEKEVHIPVRVLLKKQKNTKDQKSLNRTERKKNIANAFCIEKEEAKKGIPNAVLLIDDVVTTGSTLTECAKVLKHWGVQQVFFLSVCVGEQ